MTTAVSVKSEAQLGLPDTHVRDYILNMTTAGTEITAAQAAIVALQGGAGYFQVRGCVLSNMANLAAFAVGQNGVTYAEGDVVLLCGQTTAHQNGPWVVGVVAGTAPLTRPSWWAAAKVIPVGTVFECGAVNTLLAGSTWKCFCAKGAVVGTDDPVLYPKVVKGTATLIAGTTTIGNSSGLYLKSTTESAIQLTRNTSGTTTLTVQYQAPVTTRVAGKAGTAEFVAFAAVAAGTINVADVSTIDWLVTNW